MKDSQWMYNFGDAEHWDESEYFDTKEEAIEAGRLEAIYRGEDEFQVGQIISFTPTIDAEEVLERIGENAYDKSEYAEDYLCNLPKSEIDELQEMLDKVLEEWLTKTNNQPTFFNISNSEYLKTNEEEI